MVVIKNTNLYIRLFTITISLWSLCVAEKPKIPKVLNVHKNLNLLYRGDDCGQSLSDRIIGGNEAPIGKYPWLARLKYTRIFSRELNLTLDIYDCEGSVISTRYILTAAHCLPEGTEIVFKSVRLGEHRASTDIDCQGKICAPPVQDVDVENYVCHENFTRRYLIDDICLIRTQKPIVFNNFVHPICLPIYEYFAYQNFDGILMEVAGWGVSNITVRHLSDVLEFALLPIVPKQICKVYYDWIEYINQEVFCAGGVIGTDSCMGDSGGPLMKPFSFDSPPRYFIMGIISFGPSKCAITKTPGLYTRVDHYMTWILDNVRE